MSIYTYTHVYTYICVYIYTCTHTNMFICCVPFTRLHMHTHAYSSLYIHTLTYREGSKKTNNFFAVISPTTKISPGAFARISCKVMSLRVTHAAGNIQFTCTSFFQTIFFSFFFEKFPFLDLNFHKKNNRFKYNHLNVGPPSRSRISCNRFA